MFFDFDITEQKLLYMSRFLKFSIVSFLLVSSMIFGSVEANAQRTMRGQYFGTVNFIDSFYPSEEKGMLGIEAALGQYHGSFYWDTGFQFSPVSEKIGLGCLNVMAGVMWRPICTRDRMLNVYIGGHVIAGADFTGKRFLNDALSGGSGTVSDTSGSEDVDSLSEDVIDIDEQVGAESENDLSSTQFVYGVIPRIEFEFFPFKTIALVSGMEAPIKFKSQTSSFSARFYVGLRVNF